MSHENLIEIAVYIREVRQAAQARKLNRKHLEDALVEIERLRSDLGRTPAAATTADRNLADALDTLCRTTEEDILEHLSNLPDTLPTSFRTKETFVG